MAIKRPDEYQHQNPDLAIVDSESLRGGARVVANRTALYALVSKIDQLKQDVTRVRVKVDSENGNVATTLLLVDINNVGNSAGWQLETSGSNPGTGGGISNVDAEFSHLVLESGFADDGSYSFVVPAGKTGAVDVERRRMADPVKQTFTSVLLPKSIYEVANGLFTVLGDVNNPDQPRNVQAGQFLEGYWTVPSGTGTGGSTFDGRVITDWVAGGQKRGALVRYQNLVYEVMADRANASTPPGPTTTGPVPTASITYRALNLPSTDTVDFALLSPAVRNQLAKAGIFPPVGRVSPTGYQGFTTVQEFKANAQFNDNIEFRATRVPLTTSLDLQNTNITQGNYSTIEVGAGGSLIAGRLIDNLFVEIPEGQTPLRVTSGTDWRGGGISGDTAVQGTTSFTQDARLQFGALTLVAGASSATLNVTSRFEPTFESKPEGITINWNQSGGTGTSTGGYAPFGPYLVDDYPDGSYPVADGANLVRNVFVKAPGQPPLPVFPLDYALTVGAPTRLSFAATVLATGTYLYGDYAGGATTAPSGEDFSFSAQGDDEFSFTATAQ